MRRNEWYKNDDVAEAFGEMHGVKPEVYRLRQDHNTSKTKLIYKQEEIILTEILERGLTKEAVLEHDGKVFSFKRVIDAERAAKKIFKDKEA